MMEKLCANINLFVLFIGLLTACVLLAVFCVLLLFYLRKAAMDNERYRLIAQRQQGIWIDYQFHPLNLKVTGSLEELYEQDSLDLLGMEVYDIYDWVHPEDVSIRSDIRQFFDSGGLSYKKELRIRRLEGEYGWYMLSGALIKKKNGKNKRFVAVLQNIDTRMKQEKKLMQKAENDLLTGVLNKKTMEEKIETVIAKRGSNEHLIFFMIDLDNFKIVNDTLGHIYGDKVLTDTSDKIKRVFQNRAVIGRLGGDEFAVCVSFDAFDELSLLEYIDQKAEQLCKALKESYFCDDLEVDVSASIGIAVSPENGEDFVSIYSKADKALYLSKRSGKNRYSIFQDSAGSER